VANLLRDRAVLELAKVEAARFAEGGDCGMWLENKGLQSYRARYLEFG
jgi:hypothetical protein